jgi:hypothetical protein
MSLNRSDIQNKIDTILSLNPTGNLDYIKGQLGPWLDTQNLPYEGMRQDFIKNQILSDLTSYEGVK